MLAEPTQPRAAFVVWGAWALLFAGLLGFVAHFARNVPFLDDWDVLPQVSGERPVDASWLWSPYHEHRIPLPKLLWVALARLTRFDVRAGMFLNCLILGGLSAASIVAARRLRGKTVLADAFFPLALLHWGQHQNLLWDFGVQFLCSTLFAIALLLALVSVRGAPTPRQGIVAGLCLLGLPLCGANGLLLVPLPAAWLVAASLARNRSGAGQPAELCTKKDNHESTKGRKHEKEEGHPAPHFLPSFICLLFRAFVLSCFRDGILVAGLAGAALLLTAVSLMGETGVGTHPASPDMTATVQTACQFLVMSVGPGGEIGLPLSAFALLLLLAGCTAAVAVSLRRPEEFWRASGMLCYLAAFLGLALAVGWGRAGFGGVTAAYGTRFVTLAVPVLCWCYFAALLVPSRRGPLRLVPPLLCVLMLVLLPFNLWEGVRHGRDNATILTAVEDDIRRGVPPDELAQRWSEKVYPPGGRIDYLRDRLEWLRQTGQGPYKGRESSDPAVRDGAGSAVK
jgi:hypothetical protein